MAATALWTIHCDGCGRWDERLPHDTRAECERAARKIGWKVGKRGEDNLCPGCRPTR